LTSGTLHKEPGTIHEYIECRHRVVGLGDLVARWVISIVPARDGRNPSLSSPTSCVSLVVWRSQRP
jgi:hypothetical protein